MPGRITTPFLIFALLTTVACAQPEATDAEETLRSWAASVNEISSGWFEEGIAPSDEAINRWLATVELDSVGFIGRGEFVDDVDDDTPVFDDVWWPQALINAGIPAPAQLDEHIREPWEWAADMQRLSWEQQRPAFDQWDCWVEIEGLRDAFVPLFVPANDRVFSTDILTEEARHAAYDYLMHEIGPEEAEAALVEFPDMFDELTRTHESIDEAIADAVRYVGYDLSQRYYAVSVPFTVGLDARYPRQARGLYSLPQYLIGRASRSIQASGHASAINDIEAALEISNGLSQWPHESSMSTAVRSGIRSFREIRKALLGVDLTLDDIRVSEEAFDRHSLAPMAYHARASHVRARAIVDDWYREIRDKTPRDARFREHLRDLSASEKVLTSRAVNIAIVDVIYDALLRYYETEELDPATRLRDAELLDSLAIFAQSELMDELEARAPFAAGAYDTLGSIRRPLALMRTHRNALRTMLAIEAYRIEHGALPESLGALPAMYWSFNTDYVACCMDFGYRVGAHDGTPETGFGSGYILYSVGDDCVDNEALELDDDPEDALGPGDEGFDFVFNRPR